MMEKLLNEKEAAEYLGISRRTLKDLVRKKKLSAYKIGGQFLRFQQRDLDNARPDIAVLLKGHHKDYSLISRFKDYLYYNDFYIIVAILIIILLALVFKASF